MTYRTMYADVSEEQLPANTDPAIYRSALGPYISFFLKQYFIEDQSGWGAPVNSKSRVRSKPKRAFANPSLPASLMGMTPERLPREMQIFGTLFEEL